jgi:hypothetical protein
LQGAIIGNIPIINFEELVDLDLLDIPIVKVTRYTAGYLSDGGLKIYLELFRLSESFNIESSVSRWPRAANAAGTLNKDMVYFIIIRT